MMNILTNNDGRSVSISLIDFEETISKAVLYKGNTFVTKEGMDILSLFSIEKAVELPSEDDFYIVDINNKLYPAINLSKYYDCVLSKLLKWEFEGCKKVNNNCDNNCEEFTVYSYIILSALETALDNNLFEESYKLFTQLQELCNDCGKTSELKDCGCNGI